MANNLSSFPAFVVITLTASKTLLLFSFTQLSIAQQLDTRRWSKRQPIFE